MEKTRDLNPDLIIDRWSQVDHFGSLVSAAVEQEKRTFPQQVILLRRFLARRCSSYLSCKKENWCWLCDSGRRGIYFRGETCLDCKLLNNDARLHYKQTLVQISQAATSIDDKHEPSSEILPNQS